MSAPADALQQIGEGGALRWLEARCRLTRAGSQITVALALAWLPIAAGGLLHEMTTGQRVGLLHDATVHVRLLVCLPVLVFLDHLFPYECRHVLDQLAQDDYIVDADRERFAQIVRRTVRLGDRWLPEVVIALLVVGAGVGAMSGALPIRAVSAGVGPPFVDAWYAMIALPLCEFLLLRSLWRWAIWGKALWDLSRLRLDLESTHPDRHGGVAFLRKPSVTYCSLLLFASSSALAAEWSARFQFVTAAAFLPLLFGLALAAMLIAFGPLLLFIPQVYRARRAGLVHLGRIAARNGRWFRKYWMDTGGGELLAHSDAEGLEATARVYRDTVKSISLLPFAKRDVLLVIVATLAPMVPLMLLRIPYGEWLAMLAVLKGFP
jgi:hypothetical protein